MGFESVVGNHLLHVYDVVEVLLGNLKKCAFGC
jgi:hypothetical protein